MRPGGEICKNFLLAKFPAIQYTLYITDWYTCRGLVITSILNMMLTRNFMRFAQTLNFQRARLRPIFNQRATKSTKL